MVATRGLQISNRHSPRLKGTQLASFKHKGKQQNFSKTLSGKTSKVYLRKELLKQATLDKSVYDFEPSEGENETRLLGIASRAKKKSNLLKEVKPPSKKMDTNVKKKALEEKTRKPVSNNKIQKQKPKAEMSADSGISLNYSESPRRVSKRILAMSTSQNLPQKDAPKDGNAHKKKKTISNVDDDFYGPSSYKENIPPEEAFLSAASKGTGAQKKGQNGRSWTLQRLKSPTSTPATVRPRVTRSNNNKEQTFDAVVEISPVQKVDTPNASHFHGQVLQSPHGLESSEIELSFNDNPPQCTPKKGIRKNPLPVKSSSVAITTSDSSTPALRRSPRSAKAVISDENQAQSSTPNASKQKLHAQKPKSSGLPDQVKKEFKSSGFPDQVKKEFKSSGLPDQVKKVAEKDKLFDKAQTAPFLPETTKAVLQNVADKKGKPQSKKPHLSKIKSTKEATKIRSKSAQPKPAPPSPQLFEPLEADTSKTYVKRKHIRTNSNPETQRLSVSRLDEWATQVNAEFKDVEDFELSIE